MVQIIMAHILWYRYYGADYCGADYYGADIMVQILWCRWVIMVKMGYNGADSPYDFSFVLCVQPNPHLFTILV
jgi:hypothetical protein